MVSDDRPSRPALPSTETLGARVRAVLLTARSRKLLVDAPSSNRPYPVPGPTPGTYVVETVIDVSTQTPALVDPPAEPIGSVVLRTNDPLRRITAPVFCVRSTGTLS